VLELLNIYFDQVSQSSPRVAARSEIHRRRRAGLFRDAARPSSSCAAAFEAARLVHERLAAISLPDAELRAGIALHFGQASYGNIVPANGSISR